MQELDTVLKLEGQAAGVFAYLCMNKRMHLKVGAAALLLHG
jgi:hypothetical protein